MSKEYKCIRVTHFINPHLFWYHEADVPSETYGKVLELEQQLDQIDQQNVQKPTVGAQVLVRHLSWKKLIRARVDRVETFSNVHGCQYIMWAIDYGFPFQTKVDYIFKLPQKFNKDIKHVRLGGLAGILPAEKYFDCKQNCAHTRKTEKWSRLACDGMEKLLTEAVTIEYVESFSVGDHSWGELQLTNRMGETYKIQKYLIEMNLALDSGLNFRELCVELSIKEILPWMTKDGKPRFKENKDIYYPCNSKNNVQSDCTENIEAKRKVEEWRTRNVEIRQKFQESIHHKEALFDNMEDYDERTITDYIRNQQIGLAGEGTKMNIKKYGNGNFPPEPESHHFLIELSSTEVANQEGSNQSIRSAKDVQNEVVKPGTASLASNTRETSHGSRVHVSERLQLIMEERKKAGTQKSLETSKANETSQTVPFPTQLNKSSVKNILSDRMRQIMIEDRKNGALSAENEAKGNSVGLHSNKENMEKIQKTKLENQTLQSHNRKKGESEASTINSSKGQSERREMRSKPHHANKNATGGEQDNSSSPFCNIGMIPAGYDLSNLTVYKNEENHWHRKKSTLHDYVPHNDISLLNTN